MHGEQYFLSAFIYLTAAVIAVPVAKKLGLGSVLGYLLAGMIIGPFVLGLVGKEGQDVMHFAEFGVVMMLFLVGLELKPSLLWSLRGPILGLGGSQVLLTTIVFFGAGLLYFAHWQNSLAIGLIFAMSSTAIVLQSLSEKNLTHTVAGKNAFAVLLFQDIAVIPILVVLPLLAVVSNTETSSHDSHGPAFLDNLPDWAQPFVVLAVIALIVVVALYLSRPIFRVIARTRMRELFTAISLLVVIGIALLMTKVGLSPALGTFLAGVVLANSEYRHELESDIEPFKGLLLGVFFISVGASINFELIIQDPIRIFSLVVALIFIKMIVLFILGRIFKMNIDHNLLFTFSLAQGGEFAFVLFSFANQNGVIEKTVSEPLVAAVALSMAMAPLLMTFNEKLLLPRIGTKEKTEPEADAIDEENPVIVAGFGRFGSIVGRLLMANGVRATFLDQDADHVEILRKLGFTVFYGDASRPDLLESAGASKAKILIIAIDDTEKITQIIEYCQKNFPDLKIFARARGRTEAYDLVNIGIQNVYRETFDTAVRMGSDVLHALGFRAHFARNAGSLFKRHDEKYLQKLAALRHDNKNYMNVVRQSRDDLDSLLSREIHEVNDLEDHNWDVEALRKPVDEEH
ncbi:MAG: monovalent cation:proton antiporter-2 (CPA2) family protein [Leptospiraceae bacterium]|nr:monovalent cation:proton antiporter-2 (CPA2) family protein [Leptospiraceae bacterium]